MGPTDSQHPADRVRDEHELEIVHDAVVVALLRGAVRQVARGGRRGDEETPVRSDKMANAILERGAYSGEERRQAYLDDVT